MQPERGFSVICCAFVALAVLWWDGMRPKRHRYGTYSYRTQLLLCFVLVSVVVGVAWLCVPHRNNAPAPDNAHPHMRELLSTATAAAAGNRLEEIAADGVAVCGVVALAVVLFGVAGTVRLTKKYARDLKIPWTPDTQLTVAQKFELGIDHITNSNKKVQNAKRPKVGDAGYGDSAVKRSNDTRLSDAKAVASGVRNANGVPCAVPGCGKINYDGRRHDLHQRSDDERDPDGAAHKYIGGCCTSCCIPRASECLDYDVIAQNFGVAVADGFINAHAVKDHTTRNLFHYVASTQELSGEDVQELRLLVEHTYYTSIVAPAAAADVRLFERRVGSGANYSEEVLRALHDVADRIEADWATTAPGASQSNGVALASHFYDQVLGHIDAQCARGVMVTGTARRLKDAVENFRQGAEPNGTVYPGKLERLLIRVAEEAGDGERIVATAFTANVGESTGDSLRGRGRKQLVLPKEFVTFLEDSTNVMPFDKTGVLFYDREGVQTVHAVYQTTESDRRKLAVVGSEAFGCKVVLGCDTRPSLGGGHENDQVLAEWWASLDDPTTVLEQLALLNSATARVSTTDDGKLLSVHCHVLFYAAASPTGTGPDAPSLLRNTVLPFFEATGVANMAWVTV